MPESATPYTLSGYGTKDLTYDSQIIVAIPPADDPLTIILSALLRLYLRSAYLKCERVLTEPLK